MTHSTQTRKIRDIAHVRSFFPDAYLVVLPPGAVIVESLVTMLPLWWHFPLIHGPHHRAWTRMSNDMRGRGLI